MVKTSGVKRTLLESAERRSRIRVLEKQGAGGYAEEIIDVTGVSSISVTIGQPTMGWYILLWWCC